MVQLAAQFMTYLGNFMGDDGVTPRGFQQVTFLDSHYQECSLQQSCADGGFVWLGLRGVSAKVPTAEAKSLGLRRRPSDLGDPGWVQYPIPEAVQIPTRMHLNQRQVQGLVERLQQWLATGQFVATPAGMSWDELQNELLRKNVRASMPRETWDAMDAATRKLFLADVLLATQAARDRVLHKLQQLEQMVQPLLAASRAIVNIPCASSADYTEPRERSLFLAVKAFEGWLSSDVRV